MRKLIFLLLIASCWVHGQTMVWKTVTRMPIPVTGARAIAKDSLIYILGGYSDSLRTRVSVIQEYNPAQNSWRVHPMSLLGKRVGFIAKPYADSVVILGGISNSTSLSQSLELWRYANPSFLYATNRNFDRSYATGQIYKNKLYLFGGLFRTKLDDSTSYLIEYDLKQKIITYEYDSLISPQFIPTQQMSELVDSMIYIFGGIAQSFLSTIHRFDITTRRYKKLNSGMQRGRANGTAINIGDNKIMIIGGYSESASALPSSEIYTINGEQVTFQSGPILSSGGRSDHCAVRWRHFIFVFGGMRGSGINHFSVERLELPSVGISETSIPPGFSLRQNYPNPFNPSTEIQFTLEARGAAKLDVFSSLGEHIVTLYNSEAEAGTHFAVWDGKTASGKHAPAGIYFYRLRAGEYSLTKKMVLLK